MTPELTQKLKSLWERIDDATAKEDVERREGLEKVLLELSDLLGSDPDPAVWYAIGYAWYVHPDRLRSSSIQHKTEEALVRCVTLDPNFDHAWLYLGHHRYDLGDFASAAEHFAHANPQRLPDYLRPKLMEMRTCCAIRQHGIAAAMADLQGFVELAASHPKEDIMPRELYNTLREKIATEPLPEAELARLSALFLRLDEMGGFKDWFANLTAKS